ncbi:MAG: leucine-rich repeat domain-containing protein [Chlamydiota bacterium]
MTTLPTNPVSSSHTHYPTPHREESKIADYESVFKEMVEDSSQFDPLKNLFEKGPNEILIKILASTPTTPAQLTCRKWHECSRSAEYYSIVLDRISKHPLGKRLLEELKPNIPTHELLVKELFKNLHMYLRKVLPPENEAYPTLLRIYSQVPCRNYHYSMSQLFELSVSLLALASLSRIPEDTDLENGPEAKELANVINANLRPPSHKKGTMNEIVSYLINPNLDVRSPAINKFLISLIKKPIHPTSLILRNVHLLDFVDPLYKLTSLQKVDLSKNFLTGLSSTFSNLQNIKALRLSENPLEHIPEPVTCLPKLQNLEAQLIHLQTIPPSISKLTVLRLLNLSHNELKELPKELLSIKTLEVLLLSNNKLTYMASLDSLPNLKVLTVSNNAITTFESIPPTLKVLFAAFNQLSFQSLSRNHENPFLPFKDLEFLTLGGNPITEGWEKKFAYLPKFLQRIQQVFFDGYPHPFPAPYDELISMIHFA